MSDSDALFILLIGLTVFALPAASLGLSVFAALKSRQIKTLQQRVAALEQTVQQLQRVATPTESSLLSSATDLKGTRAEIVTVGPEASSAQTTAAGSPRSEAISAMSPSDEPANSQSVPGIAFEAAANVSNTETGRVSEINWETLIGQKAFGWIAVVLFLFATTFFLRFAYQNNWIGPLGRVAVGEFAGMALLLAGLRYWTRGWQRFSVMLSSAGIVGLYLSTYAAFGFYELLSLNSTGLFLTVIVMEAMAVAMSYRSTTLALVAVSGGLVTPLLLESGHDNWQSFFLYLTILNAATLFFDGRVRWRAVSSILYAGTQLLFWAWYDANFHPEKRIAALSFQMLLFAMHASSVIVKSRLQGGLSRREDLIRLTAASVLSFVAFRTMTIDEIPAWMGIAAVVEAVLLLTVAQYILNAAAVDQQLLLTVVSIAAGFVAWVIPVQCNAQWVSVGWAAMALAFWWFGLRIDITWLRTVAAVLAVMATIRMCFLEINYGIRQPFIPIFNAQTIPSLCVIGCLLSAARLFEVFTIRAETRRRRWESILESLTAVTGLLLLWLLLSMDCYGWFVTQSLEAGEIDLWRWRGHLALSVFWTAFAAAVLILGFQFQRRRLRWMGIALFVVTVLKLFFIDMANVHQLYRIFAFFVLAVVLGLVARTYQSSFQSSLNNGARR